MNRLVLDKQITKSPKSAAELLERCTTPALERRSQLDTEANPATFAPIHYESNYAYPLLVWLHGGSSNEHELRQIMPHVSMRNYVGIAPRGTSPRHGRGRFGWRQLTDSIELAHARISAAVDLAQRQFNIHADRIFLVGHGSGGTMALRVAWSDPTRFAGVVAINGPLPTRFSPFRNVNQLRQLPCFLATSRESRIYPSPRVCEDLRLLHSAGCTVALRQYPGGDQISTKMLSDLNNWLMDIVCNGKRDA
jgi:phospholipase/carboxylesterase